MERAQRNTIRVEAPFVIIQQHDHGLTRQAQIPVPATEATLLHRTIVHEVIRQVHQAVADLQVAEATVVVAVVQVAAEAEDKIN